MSTVPEPAGDTAVICVALSTLKLVAFVLPVLVGFVTSRATGLEPGTGFAYTRRIERRFGRVPKLAPGASRSFTLDYTILPDAQSVAATGKDIAAIQGDQKTTVVNEPEVDPTKE